MGNILYAIAQVFLTLMETYLKAAENTDLNHLLVLMQEFYEVDRHLFDAAIARNALTKLVNNESLGLVFG